MESRLLLPTHPIAFDEIEAVDIVPVISTLVGRANSAVDALVRDSSPATWDNTLGALETLTEPVEISSSIVEHLESIATTPELRAAYNATLPITTAFYTGLLLNGPLYERLTAYHETTEANGLDPIHKRLLNKTLEEFKRHGAALGVTEKVKLAELDEQLSQLTAKFSQNVLDATQAFELVFPDSEKLAGLPESALAMARASAAEKGLPGFRLTLQAPCVVAVLTYADDSTLREQLWRANDARCSAGAYSNRDLVRQIVQLRHEKSRLLGFDNFADFAMADRMAKDGAAAQEFIDDLTQATLRSFERERRELIEFQK